MNRENKERTEVGVGQEQLAGEKRYKTAYGQSRNPTNIFEVPSLLGYACWDLNHMLFLHLWYHMLLLQGT